MKSKYILFIVLLLFMSSNLMAQKWKLQWPTYSDELKQNAQTDENAYVDLAICYGYGRGVKMNKKKCKKMLEERFGFRLSYESDLGETHPYASLWYGIFLWDNHDNADYLGWKKLYNPIEDRYYDSNEIINRIKSFAIDYIGFAAEAGLEDAEILYARSHRGKTRYNCTSIRKYNENVRYDRTYGYFEMAMEWYNKACQHENPVIMLEYADYLYQLSGGKTYGETAELAYYWYKKAAEYGNAEAQRIYGWYLEEGRFEMKNISEAVKWYVKSADQGDARSMALVGRGMLNDESLTDKINALNYLKMGTEKGDGLAAYILGTCYESGQYSEQSDVKAFECYKVSAVAKDVSGLYALGRCYETGRGCDKDLKKAAEAYEECADQDVWHKDVGKAASRLADMYDQGIGVFMNKEKAKIYDKIASWYKDK